MTFTAKQLDFYIHNTPIYVERAKLELRDRTGPPPEIKNLAQKIILEFIKKNKRVMVGGMAQHYIATEKDPNNIIYENPQNHDFEFYSPHAIDDMIYLCKELRNYKIDIEGFSAQHIGTMKIKVGNYELVDITYIPSKIYDKLPWRIIKGVRCIETQNIYRDFMNILSDFTEERRFSTILKRWRALVKHNPVHYTYNKKLLNRKHTHSIKPHKPHHTTILNLLLGYSNIIITDTMAFNMIMKETKQPYRVPLREVTCISVDFTTDAKKLYHELLKLYPNLEFREYHPFMDILGKSIEFYAGDMHILRLFDCNKKCVPWVRIGEYKVHAFLKLMVFMLMMVQRLEIKGDGIPLALRGFMVNKLLEASRVSESSNKKSSSKKSSSKKSSSKKSNSKKSSSKKSNSKKSSSKKSSNKKSSSKKSSSKKSSSKKSKLSRYSKKKYTNVNYRQHRLFELFEYRLCHGKTVDYRTDKKLRCKQDKKFNLAINIRYRGETDDINPHQRKCLESLLKRNNGSLIITSELMTLGEYSKPIKKSKKD
uniref:Putative poly(A) polymerase catalytic subunit n=1 Tax=Megaviridae environmental sample TaxID=1737588 RepID=A0A5J6VJ70_9VIRU|nr:MAG: hypothetical protein [Megaviridae environmental sample]